MLMVAPSGSVKLATPLEMPSFLSAASIVTGRVALLLVVVKATIPGSDAPLK